ncbi:ergothioneine biosynthesis protein EgtB [Rubrivirga sp. S365]|uniref:ergothioneine biosynthesis protein EgtB n=1 Tax=Rubrivirga sp. S365 TaxID=3076080 RepID=UPI0028C5A5CE|nr:ergothioneine biosynthesis protein EgtB [Rubrivirga sp. S365]MDT7856933.1 ergothioneine biosynthesis protein EgtB [Rubrivirga sp. S365]
MPAAPPAVSTSVSERFAAVRAQTERLCEGLVTEDYVVQSMADVSPTKWHLAHTTWFWETFVLTPHAEGYALYDERYPFLFNSYYVQAGERHCRAQRGYLSRPTVEEVFAYRHHVTDAMRRFLDAGGADSDAVAGVIEVGLNHEQQHQELMVTDLKHVFSVNPLRPALRERPLVGAENPGPLGWRPFEAGLHEIGKALGGATAAERFHFDNEGPRHRAFVEAFEIGDRLVTCGEYAEFIADGGYDTAPLWLSLGWAEREARGWDEPFYWERDEDAPLGFSHYTLAGMRPVDPHEPVTHLTYFEADAYARWAGARLPSEAEWEVAARSVWDGSGLAPAPPTAFVEGERFHPNASASPAGGDGAPSAGGGAGLRQMFGEAWQWTHSQYSPYPGYRPVEGALGEYNGKFMANQFVLRGGSVATPRAHIRPTYRNFFPPEAAWQFTGLRLARSA